MDLVPPPDKDSEQQTRRTVQCTDGAWGVVRNPDAVSTLLLTVSSRQFLCHSDYLHVLRQSFDIDMKIPQLTHI